MGHTGCNDRLLEGAQVRIARLKIENFRGIATSELRLPAHGVLVGDNNTGKSTVLEAIDLVLGPERLYRRPVIDEHDFYGGRYLDQDQRPIEIRVEVIVIDLSDEQVRHFRDHVEWWDTSSASLLDGPPAEGTDRAQVKSALRLIFVGAYDTDEDDFTGATYFAWPEAPDGGRATFRTNDKRMCGYLFLRAHRTAARALTLERGSLLDIILRLQDQRLQIWESVLKQLRELSVAQGSELSVNGILNRVEMAVRGFVPAGWADTPHLKVTDLTREHLRKTLTVFLGTGAQVDSKEYAAPFQHQGTGTLNVLVLALLSMIAELKQNVIFAMEEPEIAIPPHAQRQIVDKVRALSAQAIFTSHSPYVLERFEPGEVYVLERKEGVLGGRPAELPPGVKSKAYRANLRARFCEALLSRRVLIVEGETEYDALPVAARRLCELHAAEHESLEAMGIAIICAQSDSQVAPLGSYFRQLGKIVYAVYDSQEPEQRAAIATAIQHTFESPEVSFEKLLVSATREAALRRFGARLVSEGEWPTHLAKWKPTATSTIGDLQEGLREYLSWRKGSAGAADLLSLCTRDEMPQYVVETLRSIQAHVASARVLQNLRPVGATDADKHVSDPSDAS
jgi:putative ATP-dependent endonuclease of the OLD family